MTDTIEERPRRRPGRPRVDEPHPVDIHVGNRIRLRRTLLGMSQEKLGNALNLTFQQVQKYERGANRLSASRLWEVAKVLDVPLSFFFDDMPGELATTNSFSDGESIEVAEYGFDMKDLTSKEVLGLVKDFKGIEDSGSRAAVRTLVAKLSSAP